MSSTFNNEMDLNLMILIEQINEIVREVTGKEIPDREADLTELGVDSMTLLDLHAVLEERLGIFLHESMIEEFHSVSQIARVVRDLIHNPTKS